MTVKEFLKMCDTSECYLEYYLLVSDNNHNHLEELTYLDDADTWVDVDTYGYNEKDEITALYKLTNEELLEKEIIHVKLGGSYAEITIRL